MCLNTRGVTEAITVTVCHPLSAFLDLSGGLSATRSIGLGCWLGSLDSNQECPVQSRKVCR